MDNLNALNVAKGVSASKAYPKLGANLRAKAIDLARCRKVRFEWSPSHAGFDINEIADSLAKRGAAGITTWDALEKEEDSDSEVSDGNGSDEEPRREGPGKTTGDAKARVAQSLISDDDEEDSVGSTWLDHPGGTGRRGTEDWNHRGRRTDWNPRWP